MFPSDSTVRNQHVVKYPAGLIRTSDVSSNLHHVDTEVLIGRHVVSFHLNNNNNNNNNNNDSVYDWETTRHQINVWLFS